MQAVWVACNRRAEATVTESAAPAWSNPIQVTVAEEETGAKAFKKNSKLLFSKHQISYL